MPESEEMYGILRRALTSVLDSFFCLIVHLASSFPPHILFFSSRFFGIQQVVITKVFENVDRSSDCIMSVSDQ